MSINLTYDTCYSLWTLEKVVLYDALVAKATSIHSWSLLIREDVLSVIYVVSIIHAPLYFLRRLVVLCCNLVFFSFAVWLVTLFLLFDLSGGTTSCLRSFYTVAVRSSRSSFDIYSRVEHCLDVLFLVNDIDKFMVNTVLHPNTVLPSGWITQIYFEL